MTIVHLSDIDAIDAAGVHWHPLRRTLHISAFGTNAYSANAGEQLIEPHTETGTGHEEMYVVITGRATFTLDGETSDAPVGTVVFLSDPNVHRAAVAVEDGTLALAVGGKPGAVGPPSSWEARFAAQPLSRAGDHDGAYKLAAEVLDDHPDNASLLYDLSCFSALGGHRERALEHFNRAAELDPKVHEWAAKDSDLDTIRDELPEPPGSGA